MCYASYNGATTTIHTLGYVVYTYYMVFFIMASVILLISMIVIVLTMHKGVFVERQEVFEQNTRDFSKTLHKIKTCNIFLQNLP